MSTVADSSQDLAALVTSFERWLQHQRADLVALQSRPAADLVAAISHTIPALRALYDGGWTRLGWPESAGGLGGSLVQRAAIMEALSAAGYVIPEVLSTVEIVGAMLLRYAPELAATHLAAALRGDEVWCQGFSEPEAGSDLGSLRTRAVADVDGFTGCWPAPSPMSRCDSSSDGRSPCFRPSSIGWRASTWPSPWLERQRPAPGWMGHQPAPWRPSASPLWLTRRPPPIATRCTGASHSRSSTASIPGSDEVIFSTPCSVAAATSTPLLGRSIIADGAFPPYSTACPSPGSSGRGVSDAGGAAGRLLRDSHLSWAPDGGRRYRAEMIGASVLGGAQVSVWLWGMTNWLFWTPCTNEQ